MQASQVPERELELDLPSEPSSVTAARLAVGDLARDVGASEENVKLAVSEAVGNAVIHAFRGRPTGLIKMTARASGDRLLVIVADDGIGMSPNIDSPGLGFGISLITKLAGEVRFDSSDSGTTVAMEFPIGKAD